MNALIVLALLVSPSEAGVVVPIENGVAPAGPSAAVIPVLVPAGGSLVGPSFGVGLDLRGVLPLLPSPVPGLVGPALNFVGNAPEAAAVHPEAGAARVVPAPATVSQDRAADKTPALPANFAHGAASLAISRDRQSAAVARLNGPSPSGVRVEKTAVDPDRIELAQPENVSGVGWSFFDQSQDKDRSALDLGTAAERPSAVVGAFGPGLGGARRPAPPRPGTAFGAGSGSGALSYAPEGEILHDAVASAFPGAAAFGGVVAFLRSAAPNGDIKTPAVDGRAAGVLRTGVSPVSAAPRPLALELSRSRLIVRVRSALNEVMGAPAQSAALAAKQAVPGPSTALLERGAMLEAFSVAHAYADIKTPAVDGRAAGVLRTAAPAAPPAPVSESEPAPLWWAWLVLPLLVAAVRL